MQASRAPSKTIMYFGKTEPPKKKSNGLAEFVSSNVIELVFGSILSLGGALIVYLLTSGLQDLKGDMAEVKTELKKDVAGVKTELKKDVAGLKTELKKDVADLKTDLKMDIRNLDTKFELLDRRQSILEGYVLRDVVRTDLDKAEVRK
jgi:hypothetical protein